MKELLQVSEIKLIYKNHIKACNRPRIKEVEDAYNIFWNLWDKDTIEHTEEVMLMLLNRSNHVIGVVSVSKGGTVGSIIDIKVILQYAIKTNAHGIILAHNHPSGNINPSTADIKITQKLKFACETVELTLFDHLIITPEERQYSNIDLFCP